MSDTAALVETVRKALALFESPDDGSDQFFGPDVVTLAQRALSRLAQRLVDAEAAWRAANARLDELTRVDLVGDNHGELETLRQRLADAERFAEMKERQYQECFKEFYAAEARATRAEEARDVQHAWAEDYKAQRDRAEEALRNEGRCPTCHAPRFSAFPRLTPTFCNNPWHALTPTEEPR